MKNLATGMVIGLAVGLTAGVIEIRKINRNDTNEWVKQEMEKSKMAIKIDVMTKRQEKLEAKITELKADRDMIHDEFLYIEELEKGQ